MLARLLAVANVAWADAQTGPSPDKPIITDSSAGSTPDVALRCSVHAMQPSEGIGLGLPLNRAHRRAYAFNRFNKIGITKCERSFERVVEHFEEEQKQHYRGCEDCREKQMPNSRFHSREQHKDHEYERIECQDCPNDHRQTLVCLENAGFSRCVGLG